MEHEAGNATVRAVASTDAGILVGTAVASALLAGGFAVIANLVGTRYLHRLEARRAHQDDFRHDILAPWLAHLQALEEDLPLLRVRLWPRPTYDGWRFRGHDFHEPTHYAPNTPLWEQSEKHWPHVHDAYTRTQKAVKDVETQMLLFLEEAHERVLGLGLEWEKDANVRASKRELAREVQARAEAAKKRFTPLPDLQISWKDSQANTKEWALRTSLANVWTALVENRLVTGRQPLSFEIEEKKDEHALYLRNHGEIARGGPEAILRVKEELERLVHDPATHKRLDNVLAQIEQTRSLVQHLTREIRRIIYDRNISGKCDYCPRF